MNQAVSSIKSFSTSTTGRLTASYLAIIMVMSIGFSLVFYQAGARELNRPLPPRVQALQDNQGYSSQRVFFEDAIEERAAEGRRNLMINLIVLNVLALVAGSFVSYNLARRALEPIEAAMEAQSRFTSDASHELRTPLATIQAETEVALRKSNLTLARAKELLASNHEEAAKLQQLAEGLLQLTSAGNSTVALKPTPLAPAVTEAINRVMSTAQAKDITVVDTVGKLSVLGDQHLLTQVLVILLDNAIKYSPTGTTVYLTSEAAGKFTYLRVRDEGPGIDAIDQPHIFERFYRADRSRSSQNTPGYGLGLSIAHQIIEQLGGSISVDSIPGRGATFTVKLTAA